MILAVDIGNTTVSVCGCRRRGTDFDKPFTMRVDTPDIGDQAELQQLLSRLPAAEITEAVISSVVPALTQLVRACIRTLWGIDALIVSAACNTGLTFAVPEPARLGADRIADAAWAAAHYTLPAVTVDLGTATTFNVIGAGGVFLGGVIAPGVQTGLQALSGRAAQLSEPALAVPPHTIGKNTAECMLSGSVIGTAAMIDGMTARIAEELGKQVTLILTGGHAHLTAPICRTPHIHEPDLLVKGLCYLSQINGEITF